MMPLSGIEALAALNGGQHLASIATVYKYQNVTLYCYVRYIFFFFFARDC